MSCCMIQAKKLDDSLHDAQVIQDGHQRREENDRRQHAKGERSPQRVACRQRLVPFTWMNVEQKRRSFVRKIQHAPKNVADAVENKSDRLPCE